MTLDDIETSIFQGTEGIEKALLVIKSFLEKSNSDIDTANRLLIQYIRIKDKAHTIPALFVNRIHVNEKLRFYVKSEIPIAGPVTDPRGAGSRVLTTATDDINKRILASTEPTVRRNREFEKNELTIFFTKNYNSVVELYNLYNMILALKEDINR